MDEQHVIETTKDMCKKQGHKLLYLVKYGSHLYGTNTEESDTDLMGLMAPSEVSLFLQNSPKSIQKSTGDKNGKNTKDDFDICIYSVQYWLTQKLRKMDINALDLYFSHTHEKVIIYKDPVMDDVFKNLQDILTPDKHGDISYLEYAHKQVRKYGLKGTMVWVYKALIDEIHKMRGCGFSLNRTRLGDHARKFVELIDLPERVYVEEKQTKVYRDKIVSFLVVCGKHHDPAIKLSEFLSRVESGYNQYGARAKLAEKNQGVDWKACSHALRAITQMQNFYTTGKMTFPLNNTDLLISVKKGEMSWSEVEQLIIDGLELTRNMERNPVIQTYKWNQDYINSFIISLYRRK